MNTSTTTGIPTEIIGDTILVNVKDIRGRQLPNVRMLKRFDKFYVELLIDGQSKYKMGIAKGHTVSWTDCFSFDVIGSSVLECRVYAKHTLGRNEFIGGTKQELESLLAEGARGAITRQLSNDEVHGNQHQTQMILEFTIATVSRASDAMTLNMEEAVRQGKVALDSMKQDPSAVNAIQAAVDNSVTVINTIKSVSDFWHPLVEKLKLFSELVDSIAEVHPYAKMGWSILSAVHKTILAQVDRDNCMVHLLQVMDNIYSFVKEAEPIKKIESLGGTMALMAKQTTECAYFICDYAMNKSFWEQTLKNSFMSTVDSKIKQYENKFKELKMAFEERAILQTAITVSRIVDDFEILTLDFDLSGMPYAEGARFDPEKQCLPGTHKGIIDEITQWVNSPNGDDVYRVFFLSGVAGSGKSAIAHAIAQLFDQQMRLGSSYCCDRADQTNRRPSNILSTIALNIADIDQYWKMSLSNIVKGNRSLQTTRSATEQFKNFILEPAKALTTVGPILVVIDALDESADEQSRQALLDILSKGISDLPPNFQILITARPEPDIVNAFGDNRYIRCKHMDTIDEASNEVDITLFVETQLSCVHSLELEWPNKLWCRMLIESSGGLFQWASTACRAIKDGKGGLRPTERLNRFVSSARGLDELYGEVLRQAFDPEDLTAISRFKSVIGRMMAVKEPLSISAHSELRDDGDPADLMELIVPLLGSLLSGVDQQHIPIRPLHASFFDFLRDQNRSKTYHVNPSQHIRSLVLSCLRAMKSGLRFNICHLETSHLRNTDVPDLTTRIDNNIPPHLSYGCRFWADHILATAFDTDILIPLKDFFLHRLLYWLEVLSLIKKTNVVSRILISVVEWIQDKNDDIVPFVNDAIKFVSAFGPPISQSTPHIYMSALPFAPKNSRVARHFLPAFPKTLQMKTGKVDDWPVIIGVFEGHTSHVTSVAFSHDGKRVASGSDDRTIRVWDIATGDIVVGPLRRHAAPVGAVAFSMDDKHIFSGSDDQEVYIWDAATGDALVGPKTPTDSVRTIAFSPDFSRIAFDSRDIIHLCDTDDGDIRVVRQLEGHTDSVNCVAFSQDGNHIASGSKDLTIRIWDAGTGDVLIGLKGHTDSVNSVAFSPDGKHIVSGSSDQTIRVWDAETGDVTAGPLTGHTNSVNAVAFSPDGKHITSGSGDHTTCVWDAETGNIVAGLLKGHTEAVNCVAFSHDGKRFISGSDDHTIRIWDAKTGELIVGPLKRHTHAVNSVAFSPDSRHLVSGSADQTICIWHAETGDVIVGPLEGHSNAVRTVTFNSDGKSVVSGSVDQTFRGWNAETGDVSDVLVPLFADRLESYAFPPDGKRMVFGLHNEIRVVDTITGDVVVAPIQGLPGSEIGCVAISQDGERIICRSYRIICVWDAMTRDVVVRPASAEEYPAVALSRDGKRIVSSSNQTIGVWDAVTGDVVVCPAEGHGSRVSVVAFSPDGKLIVSGSYGGDICVWDAETGDTIAGPLVGHSRGPVTTVAFSSDGKHIVSGSYDHTICVWDVDTRDVVKEPPEGHTIIFNSVAFSPDSKHIVSSSSDEAIRVWDAETGNMIASPIKDIGLVESVAFSPDGKSIIGSTDGAVCVWDAQTGDIVVGPLKGSLHSIYSFAISFDGRRIASAGGDEIILVWDAGTKDVVVELKGHTSSVDWVAFSPDGKHIVSGSSDQTIRVWNAETGDVVVGPLKGDDIVCSVAFSPDGMHIVSGSADRTICIWGAETGDVVVGPLIGHAQLIKSVAFSPDGKCIVSGSLDQTICVRDAGTGDIILGPLEGHTDMVHSVAFSQDGKHILSCSGDGTIRIWEVDTGDAIKRCADSVFSIALSQDSKPDLHGQMVGTISIHNDDSETEFEDTSRLENGWIFNSPSTLLFWVPSWNRTVYRPGNSIIIGGRSIPAQLDLRNFVHGESWQHCKA